MKKLLCLLASLLLLALGLTLWWAEDKESYSEPPSEPRVQDSTELDLEVAPSEPLASADLTPPAAEREAAPVSRDEEEPAPRTPEVRLFGVVRLPDQSPAAGAEITVTSTDGEYSERCNPSGEYEFHALPCTQGSIVVRFDHARDLADTFEAAAFDSGLERDYVVQPLQRVLLVLVDREGRPLAESDFPKGVSLASFELQFVATREMPTAKDFSRDGAITREFYFSSMGYLSKAKEARDSGPKGPYGAHYFLEDPPAWLHFAMNGHILRSEYVTPTTEQVTFAIGREDLEAASTTLRGRI
ncbi:MAG: hypothetical protein AAF368_06560, partial [Planctomycetota bacterium]